MLALLRRAEGVLRQVRRNFPICLLGLVFHIDDRRREELLDRLRDNIANRGIGPEFLHMLFQELGESGQVEIPVLDGAHLGHGSRDRRLRRDKVDWVVLMAQIALVRVSVLRLASLDWAVPHHLATVQKRLRLGVVELKRRFLVEETVLVELLDERLGNMLMDLAGVTDSRAIVNREANTVRAQRVRLTLMVAHHIVGDAPVELPRLDELSIALVDRGAKAVGSRNESDVILADAVPQKARERVCRNEHASDVSEMQRLVAVWHARGDDRACRPFHRVLVSAVSHCR